MNSLYGVSARKIAHLTGLLISLATSLGNITQLMTRHLYFFINNRLTWDKPLNISGCFGLIQELNYWRTHLRKLNGYRKLDKECRIYPIKVYSDSSSYAAAAFIKKINMKWYVIECFQILKERNIPQQEN